MNPSGKTILIVDDDKDFCYLMQVMFKKNDFHLLLAYNAEEAIGLIKNTHPPEVIDLVLLDIQMPRVSGYTVLEVLKELRPEIPVVAITAYGMTGEREKCLNMGFDAYISKPFEEQELHSTISQLLNH